MTSPRTLLSSMDLKAKKQLGQNFLSDPSTAEMIVSRARICASDIVLEIGPGLGALTFPLAKCARQVIAIEKDHQIAGILKSMIADSRLPHVTIIENDILKVNVNEIADQAGHPLVVMGNLPYNISSQVLIQLIQNRNAVSRAVLMFQKELAERITSGPGVKNYGRITVMLKYCADVSTLATVKSHLFFPKPKVDSEVVEIRFKTHLPWPADDEFFLSRVIQAAFGKRRKTLKNALSSSSLGISAQLAEKALECASIVPSRRAETLSIEEFVALSNCLGNFVNDESPSIEVRTNASS
ncbi:MAG: 16S rRNA (adenine(1518)-N(6)/adenine(1519)-N(6))-dimethyltransferase RsmA [Pseudomonadota bacterium]